MRGLKISIRYDGTARRPGPGASGSERRLWLTSAFNQAARTATTAIRRTLARPMAITGRSTSTTASSWAWAHGPAGAMATAGAAIASRAKAGEATAADLRRVSYRTSGGQARGGGQFRGNAAVPHSNGARPRSPCPRPIPAIGSSRPRFACTQRSASHAAVAAVDLSSGGGGGHEGGGGGRH